MHYGCDASLGFMSWEPQFSHGLAPLSRSGCTEPGWRCDWVMGAAGAYVMGWLIELTS